MRRHISLDAALLEIEAGTLADVAKIIVSRAWWDRLTAAEQHAYQRRCLEHGVALSADEGVSSHFVELVGDAGEPPLSTERRV